MSAPIPPMDPRPMRTMADMGMGKMAGMEMGGQEPKPPAAQRSPAQNSMPSMEMGDKPGMNTDSQASQRKSALPSRANDGGEMENMPGMEMRTHNPAPLVEQINLQVANPVQLHLGPEVDNVAETTTEQLSEPGTGLEGNGRRVLTYANLRARYRGADPRPPDRALEFHLTGNMERFVWGFNGKSFSQNEPIRLKLGERVRFVLINDTMMEHPIHLHGLWSELENGNGEFRPYKHTLNVKPAERLSFLVSADTPGHWAFHCHLFYHMESGMFLTVIVS